MVRVLIVGTVVLSTFSLSAAAFEQTELLPRTAPEAAAAVAQSGAAQPSFELTTPEAVEAPETGPTISLPGIGTIGTLPKFDFGLELLYGQDDLLTTPDEEASSDDLRIRGSVKHKF